MPDPPPGQKQANTLLRMKVSVAEVPAEVLRVMELITGRKPEAKEFWLLVSPNGGDSTTRTIKMYLYSPETKGRKCQLTSH